MNVRELRKRALEDLERVRDRAALEAWRVKYVGRKSELVMFLRGLADLSLEERKTLGAKANALRQELEAALRALAEAATTARDLAQFPLTKPKFG